MGRKYQTFLFPFQRVMIQITCISASGGFWLCSSASSRSRTSCVYGRYGLADCNSVCTTEIERNCFIHQFLCILCDCMAVYFSQYSRLRHIAFYLIMGSNITPWDLVSPHGVLYPTMGSYITPWGLISYHGALYHTMASCTTALWCRY